MFPTRMGQEYCITASLRLAPRVPRGRPRAITVRAARRASPGAVGGRSPSMIRLGNNRPYIGPYMGPYLGPYQGSIRPSITVVFAEPTNAWLAKRLVSKIPKKGQWLPKGRRRQSMMILSQATTCIRQTEISACGCLSTVLANHVVLCHG